MWFVLKIIWNFFQKWSIFSEKLLHLKQFKFESILSYSQKSATKSSFAMKTIYWQLQTENIDYVFAWIYAINVWNNPIEFRHCMLSKHKHTHIYIPLVWLSQKMRFQSIAWSLISISSSVRYWFTFISLSMARTFARFHNYNIWHNFDSVWF